RPRSKRHPWHKAGRDDLALLRIDDPPAQRTEHCPVLIVNDAGNGVIEVLHGIAKFGDLLRGVEERPDGWNPVALLDSWHVLQQSAQPMERIDNRPGIEHRRDV